MTGGILEFAPTVLADARWTDEQSLAGVVIGRDSRALFRSDGTTRRAAPDEADSCRGGRSREAEHDGQGCGANHRSTG